jgi:hypothetical protein
MKLESNYIKTEALGDWRSDMCSAVKSSGDYRWTPEGKCLQISTGKVYPGDQKLSNCSCLGPPPATSGGGAVYDFFRRTFLPQPGPSGPVAPSSSFSPTSMMLPAVAVVGVVGLLLILKKKK